MKMTVLRVSHYLHNNKSVNYADSCSHTQTHTDKGNLLCMCAESAKSLRLVRKTEEEATICYFAFQ